MEYINNQRVSSHISQYFFKSIHLSPERKIPEKLVFLHTFSDKKS